LHLGGRGDVDCGLRGFPDVDEHEYRRKHEEGEEQRKQRLELLRDRPVTDGGQRPIRERRPFSVGAARRCGGGALRVFAPLQERGQAQLDRRYRDIHPAATPCMTLYADLQKLRMRGECAHVELLPHRALSVFVLCLHHLAALPAPFTKSSSDKGQQGFYEQPRSRGNGPDQHSASVIRVRASCR